MNLNYEVTAAGSVGDVHAAGSLVCHQQAVYACTSLCCSRPMSWCWLMQLHTTMWQPPLLAVPCCTGVPFCCCVTQVAAEDYLVEMFNTAHGLACTDKRQKLLSRDLKAAYWLKGGRLKSVKLTRVVEETVEVSIGF